MPRRSRRRGGPGRPLGGVSPAETREQRDGRTWWVRKVPGVNATKPYVCPGCDDRLPPGEPHLVVWAADERAGLAGRRHWHSRCWGRAR